MPFGLTNASESFMCLMNNVINAHLDRFVCMYVCMYVCICMYVCMYVCMYMYMCVCVYVCIYRYICICVCVYILEKNIIIFPWRNIHVAAPGLGNTITQCPGKSYSSYISLPKEVQITLYSFNIVL